MQGSAASSLGEATSCCTADSTSVTTAKDASSSSLGWVGLRPSEGGWGHISSSKPGSTTRYTCRWSLSLIRTGATFPSPSSLPRCTKLQSRARVSSGDPLQVALPESPRSWAVWVLKDPMPLEHSLQRSLGGNQKPASGTIPCHNRKPQRSIFTTYSPVTYLVQPELCSQAHTSPHGPSDTSWNKPIKVFLPCVWGDQGETNNKKTPDVTSPETGLRWSP